ncbi:hypothetical protein H0H93_015733, partial [Arthromyces matolae]
MFWDRWPLKLAHLSYDHDAIEFIRLRRTRELCLNRDPDQFSQRAHAEAIADLPRPKPRLKRKRLPSQEVVNEFNQRSGDPSASSSSASLSDVEVVMKKRKVTWSVNPGTHREQVDELLAVKVTQVDDEQGVMEMEE